MKKILIFLIALIFGISSFTKLISLDNFELYLYSLGFFSLNLTYIVARLIIGAELILAVSLASGIFRKQSWWLSIAMLASFTLFLLIQVIQQKTENCHCFGDIVEMNPLESLLKNIVILGLILFAYKKNIRFRFSPYYLYLAGAMLMSLPFVISPPDITVRQELNIENGSNDFIRQSTQLDSLSRNSGIPVFEGKKLLCFYSTKCRYCIKAASKVSILAEKHDVGSKIIYIFVGNPESLPEFYEKSGSVSFPSLFLYPKEFLRITNGSMPRLYLCNNGYMEHIYSYRTFSEKVISEYLSEQE